MSTFVHHQKGKTRSCYHPMDWKMCSNFPFRKYAQHCNRLSCPCSKFEYCLITENPLMVLNQYTQLSIHTLWFLFLGFSLAQPLDHSHCDWSYRLFTRATIQSARVHHTLHQTPLPSHLWISCFCSRGLSQASLCLFSPPPPPLCSTFTTAG